MLGMNVHPGLRFWKVTNMDQAGYLTVFDSILCFKGQRWSLIPALSNLFQLILFQDGQMTFDRLKRTLAQVSAEDLTGLGVFLGEEVRGEITTELLWQLFKKVSEIAEAATGDRLFTFTNNGFIEATSRVGFLMPHLKEVVLELGAPVHANGGLCGNNCLHCFMGNLIARFQAQFPRINMHHYLMTTERWLEVAKCTDRWSVPKIRLSGAPFSEAGWPATIAIAKLAAEKKIDLRIHCEVSGFQQWKAKELTEIMTDNLPTIEFSLEGSKPDINHMLRRVLYNNENFYQKIIGAMMAFANRGFPISVNTAMHIGNMEDLWPMYTLLKDRLGEAWVNWVVYQLEKVGRMKDSPELIATPQKIHESSVAFLNQWLKTGDQNLPLVSLPSFGEINPGGKLMDPKNLLPGRSGIGDLTAFPRDRRTLFINPFGGLKINGMQWMAFTDHHLWVPEANWIEDIWGSAGGWPDDIGKKIAKIWASPSFQRYKNIPLEWVRDCPSCPIATWCRGGFECQVVGDEHWDGDVTSMLMPDRQACEMAGIDNTGVTDGHNLQEIKKMLEG